MKTKFLSNTLSRCVNCKFILQYPLNLNYFACCPEPAYKLILPLKFIGK